MVLRRSRHRRVVLRAEVDGPDSRHLTAWLDPVGDLHVDGQDLGPATAAAGSDGEYEWFRVIRAAHLPELLTALGAGPDADVLTVLAERYADDSVPRGSYAFEAVVRTSGVPSELSVWSG